VKFAAENMDDIRTWLERIDGNVKVELGPGVALPGVLTVADIRALPAWPFGLCIVVEREPVIAVRIEKGSDQPACSS
jgi:hypothetical protein